MISGKSLKEFWSVPGRSKIFFIRPSKINNLGTPLIETKFESTQLSLNANLTSLNAILNANLNLSTFLKSL